MNELLLLEREVCSESSISYFKRVCIATRIRWHGVELIISIRSLRYTQNRESRIIMIVVYLPTPNCEDPGRYAQVENFESPPHTEE